jgi:hypothetical protein
MPPSIHNPESEPPSAVTKDTLGVTLGKRVPEGTDAPARYPPSGGQDLLSSVIAGERA